jgi:hypothetical protein
MVMRGPAPSLACPRCGAEAPPTDEPIAHCARCKLAFDARAEPPSRPHRRPESESEEPAPPGIEVTREPGEVTIRWSYERIQGVAYLVLGTVCGVMLFGNLGTTGERALDLALLGAAAAGSLYVGASRMFSDSVLRIDERQITRRHEPVPTRRQVWVGRAEVQEIKMVHVVVRVPRWEVQAITPRGAITLADFDASSTLGHDAALYVAQLVRDAISEIRAA